MKKLESLNIREKANSMSQYLVRAKNKLSNEKGDFLFKFRAISLV